jgi:hypothetical protein
MSGDGADIDNVDELMFKGDADGNEANDGVASAAAPRKKK